jgi:tight adherence protein B
MDGLFASLEFWGGLAAVFIGFWLLSSGRAEKQKQSERLARVTRKNPKAKSAEALALRKRDPNAGGSALSQWINAFASVERLAGKLETAGLALSTQQFLMRMAMVGGGTFLLIFLFTLSLLFAVLGGIIIGVGLPLLYVGRRIKKRRLTFLKLFPEAIELIVRGLRAGLPVGESFIAVSREIPPPVGDTFATIAQQTQLGVPMEKSLSDMAEKLGVTEFNFFVTTIILQRETGGNLGEILSNLADVLRQRQMMKLKIHALSSEARASAYIVGALPFFVFGVLSILSPEYLTPLYTDYRGNMALGIAGAMMLFGGIVMKRMTQMEI